MLLPNLRLKRSELISSEEDWVVDSLAEGSSEGDEEEEFLVGDKVLMCMIECWSRICKKFLTGMFFDGDLSMLKSIEN